MPDVLERPPNQFNSETGREAAYASHKAQAELKELGERFRELAIEQAKQPKPEQPDSDALREAKRQIDLANELITHARNELKRITDDKFGYCDTCKRHGADAKEQAALIRELRGLLEHLCRLHNIPQAPTTKAVTKPARQAPLPPPRPVEPGPVG